MVGRRRAVQASWAVYFLVRGHGRTVVERGSRRRAGVPGVRDRQAADVPDARQRHSQREAAPAEPPCHSEEK